VIEERPSFQMEKGFIHPVVVSSLGGSLYTRKGLEKRHDVALSG